MDRADVRRLIEAGLPGADVHVYAPRHEGDEDHLGAVVVDERFADASLVERHQRVYDALEAHLTTDIHAIELRTYTPAELAEADDLPAGVTDGSP